jgi:ATP-binding cassette subfamily B multidrug efflux pump
MIPRAAVCAERIVEVLDTESSASLPGDPVTPTPQRHRRVPRRRVRYPGAGEPVLTDISFVANVPARPPRSSAAPVGQDHAARARAAPVRPTAGTVLVDGVDVREQEPEALWSRIGIVPQRAYLFSGTVASNLRFGNPTPPTSELWAALEIAQAPTSSRRCPERSRLRSRRAAPTCRVGSDSGSRSPGRCARARGLRVRRLRSRRSISPPRPSCAPPSPRAPRTPR